MSTPADGPTKLCKRGGQRGVGLMVKNSDFCFQLVCLGSCTGNIFALGEIKKRKIKMRLETLFFFMSPQQKENK